jgi:hypothetical protein
VSSPTKAPRLARVATIRVDQQMSTRASALPARKLPDLMRLRSQAAIWCDIPRRQGWLALALIVVVGIALRLIHITQPFIDQWSWRQSDIAMIARHFSEDGFRIWWPRIDWFGDVAGYVGTEFPLVPAVAATLYHVVGVRDWVGRVVSVAAFAVAAPLLHQLVVPVAGRRAAISATVAFAIMPLSVFAGRSFMSDMTALTFSMAALVAFRRWLNARDSTRWAIVAGSTLSLALLVKLPAATVGGPLVYLAWTRGGVRSFRDARLWLIAVAAWVAPVIWYAHALHVARAYEPHHMFGEGGIGFVTAVEYLARLRSFIFSGTTLTAFVVAAVGMCLAPRTRERWLFHWWALSGLAFTIIAGLGSGHPWYQLPLIAPVAAFVGIACDRLLRAAHAAHRWLAVAAVIAGLTLCAYQAVGALAPMYVAWGEPLRQAGLVIQRRGIPARAVFIDDGDPLGIYYSGQPGWNFLLRFGSEPATSEEAIMALEQLRSRGATLLVTTRYTNWWFTEYREFGEHVRARYPVVRSADEFTIYDLQPAGSAAASGTLSTGRVAPH